MSEFAVVNFSFENQSVSKSHIDIKLENETFIQAITHNDKLHLITILEDSSILNIYSFDDNTKYTKNEIDLSNEVFLDKKNKNTFLSKLLSKNGISTSIKITKNMPNPISIGSYKSKIFLHKNSFILSLDQNENYTQVVKIDLTNFDQKFQKIKKAFYDIKPSLKKTNSFIKDGKIFTIAFTKQDFNFAVKNLETQKLIKEYSFNILDSISFKNTPIIRTLSAQFYNSKSKQLKGTQKFLRKLNLLEDTGIAVFERNNVYQISLGGKEALGVSGIGMLMGIHKTETFSSYTNSELIYIEGLFDKELNHLKGEIKQNAFDKIIQFKNESDYSPKGKKVFKYKDYYIFGNYYYKSNKYILRKFQE